MKRLIALVLLLAVVIASAPAFALQRVNGYTKANGTRVNSYYRTEADSNPYNNFSS